VRGLRTATLTAVVLAAFAAAVVLAAFTAAAGPADAATRAPLPRLAKLGNPPAALAPGSAFTMRFRAVNRSRRLTSARATVTVRLAAAGTRVGLPGKAIVPALKRRTTYRGSRRYVLPGGVAPGSYRLIACMKRRGVKAVCATAARALVVPGASQPAPTPAPQPPSTPAPDPPAPPDTTAPSVAIDGPVQSADLEDRKPEVTGSGGTAPGDIREVSVRFTGPNGPQTRTATVGDDGRWAVRPAVDLAPGSWSVVAEQRDGAGNTGTSNTRGFGVNAVLLAAGDIAGCDTTGDEDTADLLDGLGGDAVAPLGDLVYENGTSTEFANCYDPNWGRAKPRSHPAVGNHEYHTAGAAGYFGYFGLAAGDPAKGYYSYDLGTWHVVVLNSNCSQVSCAGGSAQANWLADDLAQHPAACTLAYWHHPLFSSSSLTGPATAVRPLWDVLDAAGADLVLTGHAHAYERFARQHSNGAASPDGVRQIIVGTGGRDHHALDATRAANSEEANDDTFGVLELTMRQSAYDWEFHPAAGGTFTDSGTTSCG